MRATRAIMQRRWWLATARLLPIAALASGLSAYGQMCALPENAADRVVIEPADARAAVGGRDTLVFAVSSARFQLEHLPGAAPVQGGFLTAPQPAGSADATAAKERETLQRLGHWLSAAGANANTRIIVYEESRTPELAAYIAVLVAAAGFEGRVALLDGGLNAWTAAGYPLVSGAVRLNGAAGPAAVAVDSICQTPGPFAAIDEVLAAQRDGSAAIVDARLPAIYAGREVEGPERAGHIAGAVNVPFNSVVGPDGKLLAAARLRALFAGDGVPAGKPLIVYCHTGRKASLVYIAARQAGFNARIYWGSWAEWSLHTALPAKVGPDP